MGTPFNPVNRCARTSFLTLLSHQLLEMCEKTKLPEKKNHQLTVQRPEHPFLRDITSVIEHPPGWFGLAWQGVQPGQ
jgi:hypothetical protein